MTDRILSLLEFEYGIVSNSVIPASGGFSTKASYRITDVNGSEYFLKIYDKSLPTTRLFVERIDAYMPVLAWLSASTSLQGRILTPVSAKEGAYKIEKYGDVFVLFLYVRGAVPGIQNITRKQTMELAEILALLHEISETVPFETHGLAEDVSLSFCGRLVRFLNNMSLESKSLFDVVSPHLGFLLEAAHETLRLRDTLRLSHTPLVLCHGDAHGNNVIQSERLVLADWEELRWAPVEAELFIHAWHPYGSTLLETYVTIRRDYCVNNEMLYFYILRRRLEDIWGDIQRLTEESPNETESVELLSYIQQSIDGVQALFQQHQK